MEGLTELAFLHKRVDVRLSELLPSVGLEPTRLHEAMRYSALAVGKRARPLMCLASAQAVGGSIDDALDGACAVELVHAFSLIHDDLPAIDDDDLRRGRPTNHKLYGEALAILAGDALFAEAFRIALRSHSDVGRSCRAATILADASAMLVNGEVLDVLNEGGEPTIELVERIHERKTGALIGAACEIGAVLGGGDDDQVSALREYGKSLGIAFQIADDI
ncbi:MAG: polyprenyl synthetase family protein, partial [Fimbriimonadaceae bacterium]|nr:polyprenyl synthetase family protein [Fimbriimonadaceae bacterium]